MAVGTRDREKPPRDEKNRVEGNDHEEEDTFFPTVTTRKAMTMLSDPSLTTMNTSTCPPSPICEPHAQ